MCAVPKCKLSNFKAGGNDYAAITRDNADIIECVLSYDKMYRKGIGVTAVPKGRFIGSDAYWQEKIAEVKNGACTYKDFIKHLVESVDRANDTHLNTAINGRKEMAKRVIANCKTLSDLKKALSKNPFYMNSGVKDVDPNHILHKLAEPLPAKKGGIRCNVSFASKFCQFASKILNAGYEYSKYDNIVSKALPVYIDKYLHIKISDRFFLTGGKPFSEKTWKYAEYCDYIDEIRKKVNTGKSQSQQISREEFDHIVWYTNK